MANKYGVRVAKDQRNILSQDIRDLNFDSDHATYMVAKKLIVKVNANPYVVVHNLGYIPKALVYEVLSTFNRKIPYDDGTNQRDFSITANEIKIRGITSGTFVIYLFAQNVF